LRRSYILKRQRCGFNLGVDSLALFRENALEPPVFVSS
jgi:hypothetical protein